MARRIEQRLAASEGPRDLLAAIEFFKDPEFCHKLIAGMRWPGGAQRAHGVGSIGRITVPPAAFGRAQLAASNSP
jgi:hypothetical protein